MGQVPVLNGRATVIDGRKTEAEPTSPIKVVMNQKINLENKGENTKYTFTVKLFLGLGLNRANKKKNLPDFDFKVERTFKEFVNLEEWMESSLNLAAKGDKSESLKQL